MQRTHRGVALDTVVDSKWDNCSIFDDNGTRRGIMIFVNFWSCQLQNCGVSFVRGEKLR